MWRYRARARVRVPAEEVAARLPPAVIVEPIDERTCFANVGSDSPSMLAVWLGLLEHGDQGAFNSGIAAYR